MHEITVTQICAQQHCMVWSAFSKVSFAQVRPASRTAKFAPSVSILKLFHQLFAKEVSVLVVYMNPKFN
jgi:hypothetical protein